MSDIDHDLQLQIWGCSILGDASNTVAAIAEQGHAWNQQVWDGTIRDLIGSFRWTGDHYEQVPDSWALPGVTELRFRQECAVADFGHQLAAL